VARAKTTAMKLNCILTVGMCLVWFEEEDLVEGVEKRVVWERESECTIWSKECG
jgi:hypothetical protein